MYINIHIYYKFVELLPAFIEKWLEMNSFIEYSSFLLNKINIKDFKINAQLIEFEPDLSFSFVDLV